MTDRSRLILKADLWALRSTLDDLPLDLRRSVMVRGLRRALEGSPSLTGATASLALPRWTSDLVGGIDDECCRELQAIQLLLLIGVLIQDSVADGASLGMLTAWDSIPLFEQARARLGRVFPSHDLFWRGYTRLLRQQIASARWELRWRGRQPPFGAALLRRLGRKASLMRWPAYAVASLKAKPALGPRLDRSFERLFAVLQVLDDFIDEHEDAEAGQINALVSATGKPPGESPSGQERRARAAKTVVRLARKEVEMLARLVPPSSSLTVCCKEMRGWCNELEKRVVEDARIRILDQVFNRLLEAPA
jgi:hypothetical protein